MKRKILLLILCISLLAASIFAISAFAASSSEVNYLDYTEEDLPSGFSPSSTHPFAVFKLKDGVLQGTPVACKSLWSAANTAKDWNNTWSNGVDSKENRTSVILLRRDYTTVKYTDTNNKGDKYDNWAQILRVVYINLGGHTLTQGDGAEAIFMRATAKGSSSQGYIFDSAVTVANGHLAVNTAPVLSADVWDSVAKVDGYTIADKDFTWNFENVTFEYVSGATSTSMLLKYRDVQKPTDYPPTVAAPFYFNYTNCTFDLTNAPSSVTLFDGAPTESYYLKSTVTVNGGNIILPSTTTLTTAKDTGVRGSSVTFNKAGGSYITIDAPGGNFPTAGVNTSEGLRYFMQNSASGTDKFYLTECELDLGNGFVIPEQYGNVQAYPFVAFKETKALHGAYKYWLGTNGSEGPLGGVRGYLNNAWDGTSYGENPKEAFIFMRRDYTLQQITETKDGVTKVRTEYYDNLAQSQGTINVDLGGYTLSGGNVAASLFPSCAKPYTGAAGDSSVFPTNVVVSNGTIRHWNSGIVNAQTWDSTKDAQVTGKVYNYTFNKVTLGFVNSPQAAGLIVHVQDAKTPSASLTAPAATYNFTYNDCVFDVSNRNGAVVFRTNITESAYAKINHTVNGGKIISGSSTNVKISEDISEYSSLTFGKGSDGKYLTYVASSSAAAPSTSNVYNTTEKIDCVFTPSVTADGKTTYALYPKVMLDYKIKTSVTLWSNFVYNIYIPKAGVDSFTVNGQTVSYTEVELDGVTYYRARVNLSATDALTDVNLKVALKSGENTFNIAWTLNLLNYTKSVINGNYILAEKNLMKDMLAYTKAAYSYFETTSNKLDEVNTLIGADYNNAPDMTKPAKTPSGSSFSNVTFYLGDSPAYRFYYTGSKPSYTYSVNGRAISANSGTDKNGTYVELKVYAYEIPLGISFTDGSKTFEYNVYSYYNQADASVKTLVERLVKYCESAANYRTKDSYGTMSIKAPTEIYTNYAGKDIGVVFSGAEYNGEVTYTTNNSNVFVENGKIFANGDFSTAATVTVTAITEFHTATATVKVSQFDGNIAAERKLQYYEKNIIKEENKGGIIFIGDSYFDGENAYPNGKAAFYNDFYTDWAGEKAFLMGMSSSKIDQLEIVSERIVYPMEPSAIVIHIGHNDMHHGSLTAEQFVARLQTLVTEYHEKLPNTKIYYCGAEAKRFDLGEKADRDESSFTKIPAVNSAMETFATNTSWFTYVDTPSIFYSSDSTVNKSLYSDGSHPSLFAYDLMRIKIKAAMGDAETNVVDIKNLTAGLTLAKSGKTFDIPKNSDGSLKDFAISGKLVVTQFKVSNAHLQFRFGSKDRFLIWDSNTSDGKFGAAWQKNGTHTNENGAGTTLFDATDALILDWAVILDNGTAYYYINGQLIQTITNIKFDETNFNIGASNMNATVYDIKLDVKAENEAAYTSHVTPYFDESLLTINNLSSTQSSAILNSGKTYNDLNDNYIIRGTLDIIDLFYDNSSSNAHLQFRFASGRFLLWDNNNDGKLGVGYSNNSVNVSDKSEGVTLVDARKGVTLDWAVVVKDGTAYLYINGALEQTIVPVKLESFNIGALNIDAKVYNIEIFKSGDADYATELAKYSEANNA